MVNVKFNKADIRHCRMYPLLFTDKIPNGECHFKYLHIFYTYYNEFQNSSVTSLCNASLVYINAQNPS